MPWIAASFFFLLLSQFSFGDSGGPYIFSSDSQDDALLDVSNILDDKSRPLSFFVENVPVIELRKKDAKPMLRQWKKAGDSDPQISIEKIDQFPGQLCTVSYVRRDLLKVGVIRKSGLMILAPAGNKLHKIAYFQDGGANGLVETYTIETQNLLNDEVFLSVTCHYSGVGGTDISSISDGRILN